MRGSGAGWDAVGETAIAWRMASGVAVFRQHPCDRDGEPSIRGGPAADGWPTGVNLAKSRSLGRRAIARETWPALLSVQPTTSPLTVK